MNMFNVLYHKFVDQVKQTQIEKYNEKHKAYLLKVGKYNNTMNTMNTLNKENKGRQYNSNHYDDNRPINPKGTCNQIRDNQTLTKERKKQFRKPKVQNHSVNASKNIKNSQNLGDFNNQRGQNLQQFDKNPQNTQFSNNRSSINQINQAYHEEKPIRINIQTQTENKKKFNTMSQYPQPQIKQRQIKTKMQTFQQQVQESQNVVLVECLQGCGRKFNQKVLEKHAKNCRKIFQQKRKPFKVKVVDPEAQEVKKQEKPSQNYTVPQKKNKIPKWKKQSEQLRKKLGAMPIPAKNGEQKQKITQVQQQEDDDRVKCGGCGRKFQASAAARHVPNCMKRNKK